MRRLLQIAPYLLTAALVLLAVRASPNEAHDPAPKSLPLPLISDNFFYHPEIFWSVDGQQIYVENSEDQSKLDPPYYAYSVLTRDLSLIKSGHEAYLPAVTDAERAEYDMEYVYSADITQRYVVYVNDGIIRNHFPRRRMWVLDRKTGVSHPVINIEQNPLTSEPEIGDIRGLSGGSVHLWGRDGGGFVLRYTAAIGIPDPWWRWVSGYADDQAGDGNRLARAVELFDLAIGDQTITPRNVFDVSTDSTSLLIGTSDDQLAVWYPDDPDASYIVPGVAADTINNAAFHPADPEQIIAIGQNGLFLIELETGEVTTVQEGVVQEHRAFVRGSAFSPDGKWLAFQNQDDQREKQGIYLYNVLTNAFDSGHKPIQSVEVLNRTTASGTSISPLSLLLALAWQGNYVAIGDENGVRIYDDENVDSPLWELNKPGDVPITHVALSTDARVVAAADDTGRIWLWRDNDVQVIYQFARKVNSLAISRDGGQLATVGLESTDSPTLLFDISKSGAPYLKLDDYYDSKARSIIQASSIVAFTQDRKLLVYTSYDIDYDKTRNLAYELIAGRASLGNVAFGTERYVEYLPGLLSVYEISNRSFVSQIYTNDSETYIASDIYASSGIMLAFNDRYVAVAYDPRGADRRNIMLWDTVDSSQPMRVLNVDGSELRDIVFSPDGTRLASLTWDGMLHIWELPHVQTERPSADE